MATRVYYESSGTPAITPAVDAAWDVSSTLTQAPANTTPAATALTTLSFADSDATDQDVCRYQAVYGPIGAGTVTGAWKFQMRWSERNTAGNLFAAVVCRIFAPDGTTVRGTFIPLTRDETEMSTVSGAGLQNRSMAGTGSDVSSLNGDYVVWDLGAGGDPGVGGDHDFNMSVGSDAASDLAEDDTDTGADNPWFEFATDLPAYVPGSGFVPRLTLLGVG